MDDPYTGRESLLLAGGALSVEVTDSNMLWLAVSQRRERASRMNRDTGRGHRSPVDVRVSGAATFDPEKKRKLLAYELGYREARMPNASISI